MNGHEKAAVCMLALGLKFGIRTSQSILVKTFHQKCGTANGSRKWEEESSAVFSETTQLPRSNPALVAGAVDVKLSSREEDKT